MLGPYVAFWFVLVVVAVGNGMLREATYGSVVTELRAHQLSTLTGMILCGGSVWVFSRYFPIESARTAVSIGAVWLALTIAFEFTFGHYVAGHSWQSLLNDYDLVSGRIWVVFLVWLFLLPYLVYRLGVRLR